MVPPPDDAGIEFPDFDKMTLEEQMAWLESLARRQGANDEEFTTAADLDIAIPEDAVVDEPGYVPFFERERGSAPREEAPAQEAPAPQASAPEPEVVEAPEEPVVEEQSVPEVIEPEADPMRWLDSFTPHSEDAFGELDLDLEPAPLEDFDLDAFEPLDLEPPEPVQPSPRPVDPTREAPPAAEFIEADGELEPSEEFDFNALFGESEAAVETEPQSASEDLPGGFDPMRWLESLAVRQGVPTEELTTAADLEIPELPEDTVVDEPGYVPYDATDGTREPDSIRRMASEVEPPVSAAEDTAAPAQESVPAASPDVPELFEDELAGSLAWMSDLTAAPELDEFAAMLDVDQGTLGTEYPAAQDMGQGQPDEDEEISLEELLAGLTDEEILELQVRGELTGEQELMWLQRQAEKLAEARQLEASQAGTPEETLEEAEPAVLPDWLEEMRTEAEQTEAEVVETLEQDLFAAEPGTLPDWLTPPESAPVMGSTSEEVLDALWGEAVTGDTPLEAPVEVSASEVDAFLSDQYAVEPDPLADALDAEYERRMTGDNSEPDWYRDATAESGELEPAAVDESELDLQPAVPVDLPDWLKDETESEEAVISGDEPAWLLESEPAAEQAAAEAVPDWLEASADVFDAEPAIPEPAAPAVQREAAIPASPQFEMYREQLEQDPADHPVRLSLARALRSSGEVVGSLDHYEVLVESNSLLPDVSEDLSALASEQQADTRVHRLRGDVYMRRGMLQEALDAYRTALEQL
jgi:tetratricopeptide (TPR) repeat protein